VGGGFTLIELLAVLVVLSIVSAVAGGSLRTLGRQREAAGAQQVYRDLTYARQRAIADGLGTWVVFDTAAQAYTLRSDVRATPGWSASVPMVDPARGVAYVQTLDRADLQGARLVSVFFDGTAAVGFDRLGRAMLTGGVGLVSPGRVTMTGGWEVWVEPQTGLASLQGSGGAP
jgi:prepilin-type N-terminal cleavage/methylation domain-containing protein